jgi:3-oxoacyl-[acyl-carrier protein] reductase
VATFSRTETDFIRALRQADPAEERFFWQSLDGTDFTGSKLFAQQVARKFGRLDALVNNAGVAVEGVLGLSSEQDVQMMLQLNLQAAILLAKYCVRLMLPSERGSIVNISSIVGLRGNSGLAAYSATKAGLDGFTRSLAREVGSKGIRVNAIAPGYLETDMSSTLSEAKLSRIAHRTPLGRLGRVEDVVGVLDFLLSERAAFITGQTLVVDGGYTC